MSKLSFVHVPKTGGRHLTSTVLPYLTTTLRDAGIDTKNRLEYIHTGWPVLSVEDRVVLTYRYPPRHSVSHFFYFRPWLVDDNPENGKSAFLSAMSSVDGERISNFQTKFICATSTPEITLLDSDIEYDIDLLPERLESLLMAVDGDDLSADRISEVYRDSCYFLGATPKAVMLPVISVPEFALQYSADVYALLSESDMKMLEELNSLDMYLFTTLKSTIF